jgi:hypothetical protein
MKACIDDQIIPVHIACIDGKMKAVNILHA